MSDNRLGDLFTECPPGEDSGEETLRLQSREGGYDKCMKKTLAECGKKNL